MGYRKLTELQAEIILLTRTRVSDISHLFLMIITITFRSGYCPVEPVPLNVRGGCYEKILALFVHNPTAYRAILYFFGNKR